MATRLVMFLGRPRTIKTESGNQINTYETTTYRFEDGVEDKTSFFGLALFKWLRDVRHTRIDTLHVFGTSGSQWDALVELEQRPDDFEGDRLLQHLELGEAVREENVTQEQLALLSSELGQTLGVELCCHLVSADGGREAQYALFEELARICSRGDKLYMDITHAFRHLSMLGISSAMFFKQALQVDIHGIYYGKLAGPNHIAPVARLDALDEIAEWTAALSIFERTGRLGPLAELYATAGLNEQATPLRALAFHLATSRHTRLAESARQALIALERPCEHAIHGIIGPRLCGLLRARFSHGHVADIERQLAAVAMESGDWTQAAINLYEALLSAVIRQPQDRGDRRVRTEADAAVRERAPLSQQDIDTFHDLKNLRNIFAHGNDADAGNSRQYVLANNALQCGQFLEEAARMVDRMMPQLRNNPLV